MFTDRSIRRASTLAALTPLLLATPSALARRDPPSAPVTESIDVGANCTSTGQDCDVSFDITRVCCGPITARYTAAATHCSPVGLNVLVDGVPVAATPALLAGESSGLLDLGSVGGGLHTISLFAFGEEEGCNNGFIESWSGSVELGYHLCSTAPCTPTLESVGVGATCVGSGQACGVSFDISRSFCGSLSAQYTAAESHCSPVSLNIFVDGLLAGSTGVLDAGESSAFLDLGTAGFGSHLISLAAVGQEGGCNNGFLEAWSGTLQMYYCVCGCNLADITEVGGTTELPGSPDAQLTVDDVIVFANAFIDGTGCPADAPCSRADVCGVGGPPEAPDGQLTVDDAIAFFNAFADGC